MKKILGISLMAVLAATPLMARAEDPTVASAYALNNQKSGQSYDSENGSTPRAAAAKYFKGETVNAADRGNVATASYVKGAYNAAISAVNALGKDVEDNYGTKTGVEATVNEAQASGTVSVTLEDITPAGTVNSTLSGATFSGEVTLPVSVTGVTEWGDDSSTAPISLNDSLTATAISGSVSGTVNSTFTGTTISGATASGSNTLDVSVDTYHATASGE